MFSLEVLSYLLVASVKLLDDIYRTENNVDVRERLLLVRRVLMMNKQRRHIIYRYCRMFKIKDQYPDGNQYTRVGDYLDDWTHLMPWEPYDPKLGKEEFVYIAYI